MATTVIRKKNVAHEPGEAKRNRLTDERRGRERTGGSVGASGTAARRHDQTRRYSKGSRDGTGRIEEARTDSIGGESKEKYLRTRKEESHRYERAIESAKSEYEKLVASAKERYSEVRREAREQYDRGIRAARQDFRESTGMSKGSYCTAAVRSLAGKSNRGSVGERTGAAETEGRGLSKRVVDNM